MKNPRWLRRSGRTLLSLAALLGGVAWAQDAAPEPAAGTVVARDPVVARGNRLELRARELEATLLQRFALSQEGRELLELHVSTRLIDRIAAERGVRIEAAEVERRWNELDQSVKASGEAGGLEAEIARQDLTRPEFLEYLRISLLHQELARRDLGLARDAEVKAADQEVWLRQRLQERGLEVNPPPWDARPVARCGDLEVSQAEFGAFLRRRLARDEVEETAWHLLLARGLARRLPQLSPEALARAIDVEIDRRRAKHAREQPQLQFERYLGAQGRTLAGLRTDPAVRIAALSRLFVDQRYGPEGLKRVFEEERDFFEGRHGEALRARMIFLVASRYKNQLNPRTYEEAEAELERYAKRIGDLADFSSLASEVSEEPSSRETGGELGWLTRLDPRVPAELRDALYADYRAAPAIPAGGRRVGPVRLRTGSALLWLVAHRPSPTWDQMAEHVHEELRRRVLLDVLPREKLELVPPGDLGDPGDPGDPGSPGGSSRD